MNNCSKKTKFTKTDTHDEVVPVRISVKLLTLLFYINYV